MHGLVHDPRTRQPIEYAGEEPDDNGFSAMKALAYAMVFSFGVALAFGSVYVFFR